VVQVEDAQARRGFDQPKAAATTAKSQQRTTEERGNRGVLQPPNGICRHLQNSHQPPVGPWTNRQQLPAWIESHKGLKFAHNNPAGAQKLPGSRKECGQAPSNTRATGRLYKNFRAASNKHNCWATDCYSRAAPIKASGSTPPPQKKKKDSGSSRRLWAALGRGLGNRTG
jgi:hypothetical protein